MYPKDAPRVFAVRAGLLSEVGRVACVLDREVFVAQPLLRVQGADGLFRGRNLGAG